MTRQPERYWVVTEPRKILPDSARHGGLYLTGNRLLRCDYSHSGGPVFVDVSSGRLMMLPFNRAITPVLQASLEGDH